CWRRASLAAARARARRSPRARRCPTAAQPSTAPLPRRARARRRGRWPARAGACVPCRLLAVRVDLAVLLVVGDRLLQLGVLVARQEAQLVENLQVLLGLGQVAREQVRLAEVGVGAAVARIDLERLVVVQERLVELAALA